MDSVKVSDPKLFIHYLMDNEGLMEAVEEWMRSELELVGGSVPQKTDFCRLMEKEENVVIPTRIGDMIREMDKDGLISLPPGIGLHSYSTSQGVYHLELTVEMGGSTTFPEMVRRFVIPPPKSWNSGVQYLTALAVDTARAAAEFDRLRAEISVKMGWPNPYTRD